MLHIIHCASSWCFINGMLQKLYSGCVSWSIRSQALQSGTKSQSQSNMNWLPLFNQNVVRGGWSSYSIQHTTDTHKVHHTDSRITKKYKLSQVNKGRINLTLHTPWVMSSTVRTKYMSPMLLWFLMLKIPRAASSTILYVSWPLGVSCKDANLLWLQILKEMIAYNNSNENWDVFYKIHMISKMVSSSRTHLARSCLVSRRS